MDLFSVLTQYQWIFKRFGVDVICPNLELDTSGAVRNYYNPNEQRWSIEDGRLSFVGEGDVATTRFDSVDSDTSGRPTKFTGNFLVGLDEPPVEHCLERAERRVSVSRIKEPRSNLMIVRAGNESLHGEWIRGPRNWDLALSCFGDEVSTNGAEYVSFERGPKWLPLARFIKKNFDIVSSYKFVCLADDDLLADAATWNRIFDYCDRHELLLAQPSLSPDSFWSHPITIRDDSYALRFTNFVEVMCPVFSQFALRTCMLTMEQESRYGWGQDFLWPKLLGAPQNRIGIIDAFSVKHTRPPGPRTNGEEATASMHALLLEFGSTEYIPLLVYGGLFNSPKSTLSAH